MTVQPLCQMLQRMRSSRQGATATEFALVIPFWILLLFLFANVGRIYMARAGVLNGLGTAAREATLWPRRSNQALIENFHANSFGLLPGEQPNLTITAGTAGSQDYVELTVRFTPQLLFAVVDWQPITLTFQRRAYQPL